MTVAARSPMDSAALRQGARRVLFVDGDAGRLAELQSSLTSVMEDWEATYLTDAVAALRMLDEHPADILITELHMPRIDGSELLQSVRRRHPEIVRIVLTGATDQQASLKLSGIAHQFLTRPCPARQLRDVIERAALLRQQLRSPALIELVSSLRTLPTMPALHTEVVRLVMTPDSSLAEIGSVISRDPGMSAKVIQLVNSSFFGLRRRITDPAQAVTLLGINTVVALVLGVHLFSQMQSPRGRTAEMHELYRHALVSASASREIAHSEGLGRDAVSDFYLAGMLHDAGKLVLAANYPDEYAAVRESTNPLAAELDAFGATHCDVGAYLLGLWGLPDPIVEAAAFHHHPANAPGRQLTPLAVVHAVNASVRAHPDGRPDIDTDYLRAVGAISHLDTWIAAVDAALGSQEDPPGAPR